MALQRFLSRVIRSARTGDVRDPGGGEDLQALAGVGGAVANVGTAFLIQEQRKAKELETVEGNRQIATSIGFANQQLQAMDAFRKTEPDFTQYSPRWQKSEDAILKQFQSVTNPKAKQHLNNLFLKNKPLWQGQVVGWENDGLVAKSKFDGETQIAQRISADVSLQVAAENETRAQVASKAGADATLLTASEFKMAQVQDILSGGVWSDAEKLAITKRASAGIAANEKARVSNSLLELGTSQRFTEGSNAGLIDEVAGIKAINETDANGTEKEAAIADLSRQVSNEIQARDRALDVAREEDRNSIQELKKANDLVGLDKFIQSSRLDEKEQAKEDQYVTNETRRIAKGEEIIVNELTRSLLNQVATNIYRGTTTLTEARAQLSKSRYEDFTIDDASFRALDGIMTTEIKRGQAHDVSSSTRRAIKQITGETVADGLTSEELLAQFLVRGKSMTADERRRWGLINDLENELKDWVGANPDAQHKEFNAFAKDAEVFYKDLANSPPPGEVVSVGGVPTVTTTQAERDAVAIAARNQTEDIPTVSTQAEVDALPKGTKARTPDGREFIKN